MQLLSKFNKGFRFFLCVIDIFNKYASVIPLKDKEGISIVNAFQIILKESNPKPNKIWVDKGSEFYNNSVKKWLKDNVSDQVRISKYKNIFAKGYMPNWSEEIFIIKKIKDTVPWTYVLNDLNGEEIIGPFTEMNCKAQVKKNSE